MKSKNLRRWIWIHKWSSLICTIFLLILCLTGLPLVFSDEIEGLLSDERPLAAVPIGTPNASYDAFARAARALYPDEVIVWMGVDADQPKTTVVMAPSWEAFNSDRRSSHVVRLDARTVEVLKQTRPRKQEGPDVMNVLLDLHKGLFAGLPGELFMGSMAFLFLLALVSGGAVYGPFMRKVAFGTIRNTKKVRVRILDYHNAMGITLLAWMLVVGVTGLINELTTPMFALWQQTDVKAMLAPYEGKRVPLKFELVSPQAAIDTALAAQPGMREHTIVYPGAPFGTPYHYLIWTKGDRPLTSKLYSPALIDGRSGRLVAVLRMPWYLRAMQVSRPLHFGDYGGLPLKILWALFDIVTIAVLATGIYLWLRPARQ